MTTITSIALGDELLRYAARRGFRVLKEVQVPQVIIRHPKTDESYEIASGDFRRGKHYRQADGEMVSFEEAGFRIESLADGQPYEAPAERHAAADEKKADDK